MNFKKYINMMLLKLSNDYQFSLIEVYTYKKGKKYKSIKLVQYEYNEEDKIYIGSKEFKNDMELLKYLKEMV